jgi:hypothetical protein
VKTFTEFLDAVVPLVAARVKGVEYGAGPEGTGRWRHGDRWAYLGIAFWPPGNPSHTEFALISIGPPGTSDAIYVSFDSRPEVAAWFIASGLQRAIPEPN